MRGEYAGTFGLGQQIDRFIPTCVGNTNTDVIPDFAGAVHPHMRGEYMNASCFGLDRLGSSPHAWGIRNCAGERARGGMVHPHMRGEYAKKQAQARMLYGSSPHAWGIRAPDHVPAV